MKGKCKNCGETEWLLEKSEKRHYYSNSNDPDRWIEYVKKREVDLPSVICSKCNSSALVCADLDFEVKLKPLRLVWMTAFWDNLNKQIE